MRFLSLKYFLYNNACNFWTLAPIINFLLIDHLSTYIPVTTRQQEPRGVFGKNGSHWHYLANVFSHVPILWIINQFQFHPIFLMFLVFYIFYSILVWVLYLDHNYYFRFFFDIHIWVIPKNISNFCGPILYLIKLTANWHYYFLVPAFSLFLCAKQIFVSAIFGMCSKTIWGNASSF